jgi:hypothetical protein
MANFVSVAYAVMDPAFSLRLESFFEVPPTQPHLQYLFNALLFWLPDPLAMQTPSTSHD